MKKRRVWRRLSVFLTTLVLSLNCLAVTAQAREPLDTDRKSSLTIHFGEGSDAASDNTIRLYRVADISKEGYVTLSGAFAGYPVSLEDLDSSGWRAAAQTLEAYAVRDRIEPTNTAQTGSDGKVVFEQLSTGLYLVVGDTWRQGGCIYTPQPQLVSLPNLHQESGEWTYDTEVFSKYDSREEVDTVSRKVLKIWKDDGAKEQRPESIRVQLLKDGEVYETVVLNESNNWQYNWKDLDSKARWRITEAETPQGYTVTVSQQEDVFVMTNTYETVNPNEDHPNLPQTGLLWWPVPLLAFGGLLLFLIGWRKRQNED